MQLANSPFYRLPCRCCVVNVLFGDAVEGGIIIEAKVTGVDDVVGSGLACEIIQRSEVS